jgi:mannose-1-phosphate guanylyltransferase
VKAFLLAAGHGTRLRPLTDTTPKCLLPIRGTPMLEIWLRICRRYQIREVLLNLHSHANKVRDFLDSCRNPELHVHLVEEEALLGSAGTLLANRAWVAKEQCFWIFYADVLTAVDLTAMLASHHAVAPIATLGVYPVPDPARCGIVTLSRDGKVEKFVEKPSHPQSNLAFSGLMLGTPELMEAIPPRVPLDIGFDLLPRLTGRLQGHRINDYVLDIGTPENYALAQQTWPGIA